MGAAAGFGLGLLAGLSWFDDSTNSDRKVWSTAAAFGAAGGLAGYFAGRALSGPDPVTHTSLALPPGVRGNRSPEVPILVELFTSEGCSSCPPADLAFSELLSRQPVPGARIIGLSEHVDYWDRLGWRDPFSSPAFTARQSTYARDVFSTSQIYTPQMVVSGQNELVGSDVQGAVTAIGKALIGTTVSIEISTGTEADASSVIPVQVAFDGSQQQVLTNGADVLLAITEDGLVSQVRDGENAGRELHHDGVVRSLKTIGSFSAGSAARHVRSSALLESAWKRDRIRLIAFLQEQTSHRILGAASVKLD